MLGFLNKNKIEYVLYHMRHCCELNDEIIHKMRFVRSLDDIKDLNSNIVFLLSENDLSPKNILNINSIPILFPVLDSKDTFRIDENKNLIFNHDLLKSSFYLLTCYEEYLSEKKDPLGRFPYEKAIQNKLGIIKKPVVNYYFEMIYEGIKHFCMKRDICFSQKKVFDPFAFFISHDVDRITKFNKNNFLSSIKRLLYPDKNLNAPFSYYVGEFFESAMGLLKLKRDPYWMFEYMLDVEKKHHFISSFFFLDVLRKEKNYDFYDQKTSEIFKLISRNNNEVGLHGTIDSALDGKAFFETLKKLEGASNVHINGVRFHNLVFENPQTIKIISENKLKYDSTIGFPTHEGFKSSYCQPYKLYDLEKDSMTDVWEIPLNVMDSTLLYYRKLSFSEASTTISDLVNEIKKFGGVFSLLWHNSYYNERLYPGIKTFYESLLQSIANEKPSQTSIYEILNCLEDDNSLPIILNEMPSLK